MKTFKCIILGLQCLAMYDDKTGMVRFTKSASRFSSKSRLFSRASQLCHRARDARNCLLSAPQQEGGCQTVYEIGHCWEGTDLNGSFETACPQLDSLSSKNTILNLSRLCYPPSTNDKGEYIEEGWHAMGDFLSHVASICHWFPSSNTLMNGAQMNDTNVNVTNINDTMLEIEPNMSWNTARDICLVMSFMSFTATFASLFLMTFYLKKCTRIYIHMNLLFAFMLRTLLFIWTQAFLAVSKNGSKGKHEKLLALTTVLEVYEFGPVTNENLSILNTDFNNHCIEHFEEERKFLISCKLYPVLFQYVITATYFWMCCEGIYLILLQSRPMMISARNGSRFSPLRCFILISWGFPAVIVGIWIVLMLNRPNSANFCFRLTDNSYIVEIPIQILVVLSLFIFVILIKDLVEKLRAPVHINGGGNFHIRMTKAIISLIPLLGVQTGVLPLIQTRYGFSQSIVDIVFPINIFLASSQGFIVSVLYCFTSHEVKKALTRRWYMHWEVMRINREIISRRQSRDSQGGLLSNIHEKISLSRNSRGERFVPITRLGRRNTDPGHPPMWVTEEKRRSNISGCSDDSAGQSAGYHSGHTNQSITIPSSTPSSAESNNHVDAVLRLNMERNYDDQIHTSDEERENLPTHKSDDDVRGPSQI